MISDSKSCVFSLYSNGRLDQPMKFNVKEGYEEWSFQLYQKEWGALFAVGSGNDICVKKQNRSNKCYCKQASYDYHGIENALIGGNQQKMAFGLQRLLVYQMKEIEQPIVIKKEEDEEKEMKDQYQHEIQLLESWTEKKYVNVLHHSTKG